jgi:hypothetical protein
MKLKFGFRALLLGIVIYFTPAPVIGQVITEGPDSVLVSVPDTAQQKTGFFLSNLRELDRPAKAALWSAVIPGAGQFYNKAYWKIPLVYATGAVLGYFLIDNNNKYQSYRVALIQRTDGNPATVDEYADHPDFPSLGVSFGADAERNIRYRRDYYRRNRDLTILLSIGAHGLQIAEAYVHAHLKDFDVSNNLAMRVQPNLVPVATMPGSPVPGLTFTLYTRTK